MFSTPTRTATTTVTEQLRRRRVTFAIAYGSLALLCLLVAQFTRTFSPFHAAGMLILILLVILTLVRPAFALGATIVLTLVGDQRAMPWWPADKNLSSAESVLFTADGLTVKPVELMLLAVIFVVLVNHWLGERRRKGTEAEAVVSTEDTRLDTLRRPMAIFTVAIVVGLIWGIGRGGEMVIGIFDATPLLYIPLVYRAATALFTSVAHYRRLLTGILVALTIEGTHGLIMLDELRLTIPEGDSPVNHTAALHMNLLFLSLVAAVLFGTRLRGKRLVLLLGSIPTMVLYLEAERRAAIVAFIVGCILLGIGLFYRNRMKFTLIVPVLALVSVAYVGALWNSTSPIAFPAQAVKTVVSPESASDADSSSDLYRDIENFNLLYTVRTNPLLGIGFGQPFMQPIPLPDISFFEFAAYIPHNSVYGMWLKTGFVGIASFVYLIGSGLAMGISAALRYKPPDDASMVLVFTAYLPMTLVLNFVEISFDAPTTVLLAVSLALAGSAARLAGGPGPVDASPSDGQPVGASKQRTMPVPAGV